MMLTKRLKAFPFTVDVGVEATAVARSEAMAAEPVAVAQAGAAPPVVVEGEAVVVATRR